MAAIDYLLGPTQNRTNLGTPFAQSAQTGSMLGAGFRDQTAQLTAEAAERRAQNAAAFELSVRAARAAGEAKEKDIRREVARQELELRRETNEIQREQNRLRSIEAGERIQLDRNRIGNEGRRVDVEEEKFKYEKQKDAEERRRRDNARRRLLGQGGSYGPYSSDPDVYGEGGIDTPLFGEDQSNFGEPKSAIGQRDIPGLRTTWYNRSEPGADSYTKQNLGAWGNNQLSPHAIALSPDVAAAIGATPGALLRYKTDGGVVGYGTVEDKTADDLTGRVDLHTSDAQRAGVDQKIYSLEVLAPGIDAPWNSTSVSGDELRKVAESNYARRNDFEESPEPTTQELAQAQEESIQVDEDGTDPSHSRYDPDYLRDLPAEARLPFRRKARTEFQELQGQKLAIEAEKDQVGRDLDLVEDQIRESIAFNRQPENGGLAIPDPRLAAAREQLSRKNAEIAHKESLIGKELLRAEENLEATKPEFKYLLAGEAREASMLSSVKPQLAGAREAFDKLKDEEIGRLQGVLTAVKDKAFEQADYSVFEAKVIGLLPTLAREVFNEVGVLTDQDMARYRRVLPGVKDSRELGVRLFDELEEILNQRAQSVIRTAVSRGADVAQVRSDLEGYDIGLTGVKTPERKKEILDAQKKQAALDALPPRDQKLNNQTFIDPVTGKKWVFNALLPEGEQWVESK